MMQLPTVPGVEQSKISNALAMELAAQLTDLPDILDRYGLTKAQLKKILGDPEFKIIFAQAKARWGADANATERVISKSTLMVEDSLMMVYGIMHNADTPASGKLAAFNALVELSDAAPRRQAAKSPEAGDKFSITINLSGGSRTIELDTAKTIEGEVE